MIANIRARLVIAEALLSGKLSGEEARARRTEALKRSRRGRLLLRIERIEKAGAKLATMPPWRPAGSVEISTLTQGKAAEKKVSR